MVGWWRSGGGGSRSGRVIRWWGLEVEGVKGVVGPREWWSLLGGGGQGVVGVKGVVVHCQNPRNLVNKTTVRVANKESYDVGINQPELSNC